MLTFTNERKQLEMEKSKVEKQKKSLTKVRVKPEKNYLQDKKGEKIKLTMGMVTEARVKYEKITYMKYFIEQIGVKFD